MLKLIDSNINDLEDYRVMDMIDGSSSQELVYSQSTICALRNMYTVIQATPSYENDEFYMVPKHDKTIDVFFALGNPFFNVDAKGFVHFLNGGIYGY